MNTKTKTGIVFIAIVLGLIISPAVASGKADAVKAKASLADRNYTLPMMEEPTLKTELQLEEHVFLQFYEMKNSNL